MNTLKTDFLILGGGLSGLLAADFLSGRGENVVLVEKENHFGGLARTLSFNGCRYDIGGHKLSVENYENAVYFRKLLNDNELYSLKRKSKIFFDNKYVNYPINLTSLFNIKKENLLKILFNILSLRKRNDVIIDTFEKWVLANYGDYLYKIYFEEYTKKVWGVPCEKLSSCWADKRIGRNSFAGFFKNILLFRKNKYVKDASSSFYYPKLGIGEIIDSLEQNLKEKSKIYKNVRSVKFLLNGAKLSSMHFIYNSESLNVEFKEVISSIPIKEFVGIMPDVPQDIRQETESGIRYRNLIIVCLEISKKLISDWHWCYFPAKDIIFSRICEPKFWSKYMAPETKTLLCAEIFCEPNDFYWRMNDKDILSKTVRGLMQTRLIDSERLVLDACVRKIDYAYPLTYYGFEKSLDCVKDYINSFSNVTLIGRSGRHSYYDMEECLSDVRSTLQKFMA